MKRRSVVNRTKIKKNRIWITVVLFLLLTVLMVADMALSATALLGYAMNTKLSDTVLGLTGVFEEYEKTGSVPASFTGDYFVNDGGNVVDKRGRDTCAKGYSLDYSTGERSGTVKVYSDSDDRVLAMSEEEGLKINLDEVVDALDEEGNKFDIKGLLLPWTVGSDSDQRFDVPVWIARELSDGREVYLKSSVVINATDYVTVDRLLSSLTVVYMVVLLIVIINAVNSILNQKRLIKMFFTDGVTGGRNWSFFLMKGEQRLKKRRNAKRSYAVLDVDVVKYLNFCICHSISEGEKLLCRVYRNIKDTVGRRDMVVRCNSADFAVLMEIRDPDSAREKINSLMKAVESAAGEYSVNFHMGAYLIEGSSDRSARKYIDLEELYNNASTAREALDNTDESGISYFDSKMVEDQRWVNTVSERQQAALDNEEFVVYYQPKYDPRTDTLRGAEALIRWQSPEFGFLTPYKFIPIFENNGFITEIDHYMIAHAARDQKRWLDMGLECVPVSVNVSRTHFAEPDLAEQIRDMVDKEGTPHELIEIELTESAFFDDKKAMLRTVTKLKEYGFAVSMDDFGSGYSSLNSLKDMPLDVLKLDAEFFRGENADQRGRIVVAEAIRLARSLEMRTVAEGVEIKEQVDFLAEQQCDMIQGYYYAKPMPGQDYEQKMKKASGPQQ